jgi:hypothetical protein
VRLTFKETSSFTRLTAELLPDEELDALQWALMANPECGDLKLLKSIIENEFP